MRPDDRRRRSRPVLTGPGREPPAAGAVPAGGSVTAGGALVAIEAELAKAGARIRAQRARVGADRPDPAFAAGLRSRLVGGDPVPAAEPIAAVPVATPIVAAPGHPTPFAAVPMVARAAWRFAPATIARWTIPAVAGVLVVALIASTSGRPVPTTAAARATDADGVTLVRAGTTTTLVAGTALLAGDELRVAVTGRATLELGGSRARLDGGADLRLDDLTADRLRLELLAGRSYNRVAVPTDGTYAVATGSVTWTARGTAFDLDREPTQGGADRITLLGLEHSVEMAGPNGTATVGQGEAASLTVAGDNASDLVVVSIDQVVLADPWLVANARADQVLGFPLGVLDLPGVGPTPSPDASLEPPGATPAGPTATSGTTPEPAASPDATPGGPSSRPTSVPTSGPDSNPTTKPTPAPTPRPTDGPTPTPAPTPTPVADLRLRLTSCDGGVIIGWSRYRGTGFDRYVTLRSSSVAIPRIYPPRAGTTVVDGSALSDRSRTGIVDTSGTGGASSFYRTVVLDPTDAIVAASPVEAAVVHGVRGLGALDVGPADGSQTAFGWTAYDGPRGCFTRYALVWSIDDPTPSALTGADVAYMSSDRTSATASVDLAPGTYHLRLEVLRSIGPGASSTFVVAHSDVVSYTVP